MRKGPNHSKRSWASRLLRSCFRRLFCHRNIIIISEHKTDHLPVGTGAQLGILVVVLGFVIWASYSTGNFMAAQDALQEKERKIASTNLENRRIESEFALLKRDLITMIEQEQKGEPSDYAKFVIEQYKNADPSAEPIAIDASQLGSVQHSAVFERIAFLEQTVEGLKENHEMMLESIRAAARGKLTELETIIKTTGLDTRSLERKASARLPELASLADDDNSPRGGPYYPLYEETLLERDAGLYRDLKRMTLLADVVDTLPLAEPMREYKITSGFGVRMDPFRKRLARHTGVDFSGPYGAKIRATSDGVVTQTGRRGAYGNSVEIAHKFGISTLYGHLQRVTVREGQRVRKGDVVGIQGSTGRSTGPHLHYEVRYNDAKLNPAHFLKAGAKARKQDVR